jgi:hypothetical protein
MHILTKNTHGNIHAYSACSSVAPDLINLELETRYSIYIEGIVSWDFDSIFMIYRIV